MYTVLNSLQAFVGKISDDSLTGISVFKVFLAVEKYMARRKRFFIEGVTLIWTDMPH